MKLAIVFRQLKRKCGSISACSAFSSALAAARAEPASSDSCSWADSWSASAASRSTSSSARGEPSVAKTASVPIGPSVMRSGAITAAPSGQAGWRQATRSAIGATRVSSAESASKTGRIGSSPAAWWSAPAPTYASTRVVSVTETAPNPSFSKTSYASVRAAVSERPRRSSGRVAASSSRVGASRRHRRTRGIALAADQVEHFGHRRDPWPLPPANLIPEWILAGTVDEDGPHADALGSRELVVGAVTHEDCLLRLDRELVEREAVDPRIRL